MLFEERVVRNEIAQPTCLPWLGYFDLIDQVDKFAVAGHGAV